MVVRELGERTLHEVPLSEITALVELMAFDTSDPIQLKRSVLKAFGLIRLTESASEYIDEGLRYSPGS